MAPFSTAIIMTPVETREDGTKVYEGQIDEEWTVGHVAFGGGMLAMILEATSQYQALAGSRHPDPMFITSQFLRAVLPDKITISIQATKIGKQVTMLEGKLHQKDKLMVTSQMIYSDLSPKYSGAGPELPELYRPICPLETHPSEASVDFGLRKHPGFQFNHRYKRADDPILLQRNDKDERNAEGLVWGSWLELEGDATGPSIIPVLADIGETPWRLLPKEITEEKLYWSPSLTISIEFKRQLPLLYQNFAPNTFGMYARKRHLEDGRFDDSFEIWTAPGGIGEKKPRDDEDWRERMVCVAIGTQVALSAEPEINSRYVENGKSKL